MLGPCDARSLRSATLSTLREPQLERCTSTTRAPRSLQGGRVSDKTKAGRRPFDLVASVDGRTSGVRQTLRWRESEAASRRAAPATPHPTRNLPHAPSLSVRNHIAADSFHFPGRHCHLQSTRLEPRQTFGGGGCIGGRRMIRDKIQRYVVNTQGVHSEGYHG